MILYTTIYSFYVVQFGHKLVGSGYAPDSLNPNEADATSLFWYHPATHICVNEKKKRLCNLIPSPLCTNSSVGSSTRSRESLLRLLIDNISSNRTDIG